MQAFLAKHHITDKTIAVGVSGGADSLALVLKAAEELKVYGYKIVALTVNHRLRPNAAEEAHYVAQIMAQYQIEHHILEWTGNKPTTGIEEAARAARYDLLKNWCDAHDVHVLMVAHHLQDQAETFLMRLQRGSGLEGLSCMREVSTWHGLKILRPLLNCSPQELRDYLQQRGVRWVEDESNQDMRYLRNKIRAFLPEIERQIGIKPQGLAATAMRLQSAEDFIEIQTEQIYAAQVQSLNGEVAYFKYADFLQWHREIKFRILGKLCRQTYIPRAERILKAIGMMKKLPFGGLTLGGKEIFCAYGLVWIVPELNAKRKASREAWKEFVQTNPEYAKMKVPHKVRVAILKSAETAK